MTLCDLYTFKSEGDNGVKKRVDLLRKVRFFTRFSCPILAIIIKSIFYLSEQYSEFWKNQIFE